MPSGQGAGRGGWIFRGLGFGVLAVADEGGADHDEDNAGPAGGGDALVEEPNGGEGGEDETQRRQGPEEADIAPGHEDEEAGEEEGLEKDTEEDLGVGDTGADDADDLGKTDLFHVADLSHAFLEEDDPGAFENKPD